jgi:hypothetical protein
MLRVVAGQVGCVVGGRLSCFAAMKKIGDTGILVRFGFVKETSIPREQQPK